MILDRYLVKQFVPIFLVAIGMFAFLLILIDLFANLWRYLNYEVPVKQILTVSLYYLPKSFSYALPISLLFAAAYTLGDLYGRNELTSIFSSGIPFWRFSIMLAVIGVIASVFSFFFDDRVVVPTLKMKNDLASILLHQQRTEDNSDIVIKARNGEVIYMVDYFDDKANILNGLVIVENDGAGRPTAIVRAPQASWTEDHWTLSRPMLYEWQGDMLLTGPAEKIGTYSEAPDTFKRNSVQAEDLPASEAKLLVADLRAAGLPYNNALAEYYHRYSFAAASFVVMLLSISMGGRFRKNILLMSLLSSLVSAVVFYVMEMITMMLAKMGYIPPIIGAWFPVFMFILAGAGLMKSAKT
ncbi:MAG: LptF/LptG family permease [Treponema sp.]|jgi:lipopolysaccharide export system permease protein|nr:LptF/LptG family permease [Treponema sp.]